MGLEISLTLLLPVSIATQIAVIIADVIVLMISWRSALGTVREAARLNIKTPLSMVLLRDGKSLEDSVTCNELTNLDRYILVLVRAFSGLSCSP